MPSQHYCDYLEKVGGSECALSGNWFTRYEVYFLHHLLMVCTKSNATLPTKVLRQASLSALTSIPSGGESIGAEWLSRIIFHPDFVGDELETAFEEMRISQPSLLAKTVPELGQLAAFYTRSLFRNNSPHSMVSKNGQILPADWIYLPLVAMYQRNLDKPLEESLCGAETALRVLQGVHILLPAVFQRIQPAEHYARLACIFLAGNDLFLDVRIAEYLSPILRRLSSESLDLANPINGVEDFVSL